MRGEQSGGHAWAATLRLTAAALRRYRARVSSPLECLRPLMSAKGATLSPEGFHDAVNVAFHDIESASYDELHGDM